MSNDKPKVEPVSNDKQPVAAKPPHPYSPPVRTKGAEEESDPYLDKILAQSERSNITNDYRPPREASRRFMLSRVEPESMPPPEEIGLLPPETSPPVEPTPEKAEKKK